MGSTRVSDEMVARVLASIAPCTLQPETWGTRAIEWSAQKRPVWAWVTWPNRAATREPAWATGGNDRVVMLEVPCAGGHWAPVVWRNAVSVRRVDADGSSDRPPIPR